MHKLASAFSGVYAASYLQLSKAEAWILIYDGKAVIAWLDLIPVAAFFEGKFDASGLK